MPVNMPTHAHGHGYSDLNFLIPELVSGVQYSKGPYFADQGDFATAGAANINYANALDRPIVRVGGGDEGFGRALVAGVADALAAARCSRRSKSSTTMVRGNGPTTIERSTGWCATAAATAVNGFSVTGMGYRAKWNSTDQMPQRAVDDGLDRTGSARSIARDGGDTYRYSGSVEWQRTHGNAATRGDGLRHRLRPQPVLELHVLPRRSRPRRSVSAGGSPFRHRRAGSRHRRLGPLGRPPGAEHDRRAAPERRHHERRPVSHAGARSCLDTIRQDAVLQTSGAAYVQNETAWTPWLRTLAGLRVDGYRFDVDASDALERR